MVMTLQESRIFFRLEPGMHSPTRIPGSKSRIQYSREIGCLR